MFTEAELGETFRFLGNKVNCFPGNQSLSDLLYSWKFWSWKVIKPHLNNGCRSTFQGFWYFTRSQSCEIQVNLWNHAKFTKTRKIARNSVEILSNTCLCNVFETYFSYRGYLLAVNLQIYLGTSSLKRANNIPKLPGVDYISKNWALAIMLKALPLVHFWSVLLLKEQMMTSVR